jgi:cytoskeletal protein CcmA (bactofilin family)
MFTKNSKETETAAPVPPKRTTRTAPPSIISADLVVTGTLASAGDVQIDGRVEGDIRATSIVIGEHASILGDVSAEEAIIRGRVEGSIRARKVQLCATSHVEGNILHEALSVEAGAFFEGNCRHSDNSLGDGASTGSIPAPAPKPAATVATVTDLNGGASSLLGDDARPVAAAARATASFTPLKS